MFVKVVKSVLVKFYILVNKDDVQRLGSIIRTN